MRSCSGLSENSIPHHVSDAAVVEAELDQDLARVLAEFGHVAAQLAAAAAVGEHREGGEVAARRFPLPHLRQPGRLRGREAEVDGHVVRLAKLDPLRGALLLEGLLQQRGERIAVRTPASVGLETFIAELGHELYEVLPEMLFQHAEREPL